MKANEPPEARQEPFDDLAPFRELFLSHLSPRGRREVVDFGRLLAHLLLESPRTQAIESVATPRGRLKAATEDLRYLQQYLAHLRREPEFVLVSPRDRRLCALALEISRTLRGLVRRLDVRLQGE